MCSCGLLLPAPVKSDDEKAPAQQCPDGKIQGIHNGYDRNLPKKAVICCTFIICVKSRKITGPLKGIILAWMDLRLDIASLGIRVNRIGPRIPIRNIQIQESIRIMARISQKELEPQPEEAGLVLLVPFRSERAFYRICKPRVVLFPDCLVFQILLVELSMLKDYIK